MDYVTIGKFTLPLIGAIWTYKKATRLSKRLKKKPTWREGAQWLWKMRVPALVGVGTSAVTAVIFCKAVDPNLQSMMLGIGVSILYNAIALCLAIAWDVATDFHKKVQATRSSDAEPTS